jgi:3-methylcrotonyl-CoA carboxylase alpha subunit
MKRYGKGYYFDKILIANRGEIAIRLIHACRELGIAAVAVYSEADRGALHVRLADEAYPIGPAPAAQSYLSVERIIAAAQRSGVQAIHPGYGFLSERAHFARACAAAGLVFIGPPPEAIELMGSKIAAKRLAEQCGVPIVPGYMGDDQRPARLRVEAARIGFPLLIKASAGGGGKGMRVVGALTEFDAALEGAQREARAAFGDDAVFLERLIERPRHVEIQILADAHGNCVHLFERECSIQRRHQKIVEESPSPALSPELRAAMGAAAVRLAQAAGYRNAGTVEFMLDQDGEGDRESRFFFLEMNTRLQVEHPVTEAVTGLDLVRLQIALAAGERLPFQQAELAQRGHAIEMRVYAEDPVSFLPSTGRVALFAPPAGPGIRNDIGLASGDEVTLHYDPLLAKLIVAAPDRPAAIARQRSALEAYVVLGVTTNLPLLRAIAAHPDFAAGATSTDFLAVAGLVNARFDTSYLPPEVLVAAAICDSQSTIYNQESAINDPWRAGPWRLMRDGMHLRYIVGEEEHSVVVSRAGDNWRIEAGGEILPVALIGQQPNQLTLEFGGQRIERFSIACDGAERLIAWRGASFRLEQAAGLSVDALGARVAGPHGHASLAAPMPGTVLKVLAEEGQTVAAQQPLVVLEAMKMEHVVVAPYAGVVQKLCFRPGALVAKGATLVELEEQR